ncbi:hypothetical protein H7I87_18350 [Mycobacterium timonense]|uniref:Uncharacterized protein n=2 Tax=Mycobacterium avium complex (MAC) TaxID=120793 RepID=A0AAW5S8K9_MYCBC|nr:MULTISPECIES: hypothetical protein [Mycobacterium avium complex (MAC)]MCV6991808.1 hypothetical protein [Mycobacterium bouchedurhonense]MCV6996645.1 hypothetical protein [Mycobacterium timonense]ORA42073.1 hypothetical protein BST19_26485 [Mycobacterium bouchedurhonense]ORB77059.1 hypothetical protein BST46_26645 [Mycobacterium timonense]
MARSSADHCRFALLRALALLVDCGYLGVEGRLRSIIDYTVGGLVVELVDTVDGPFGQVPADSFD